MRLTWMGRMGGAEGSLERGSFVGGEQEGRASEAGAGDDDGGGAEGDGGFEGGEVGGPGGYVCVDEVDAGGC